MAFGLKFIHYVKCKYITDYHKCHMGVGYCNVRIMNFILVLNFIKSVGEHKVQRLK